MDKRKPPICSEKSRNPRIKFRQARRRNPTANKLLHLASRSASGFHPLVKPVPIAAEARTSCIFRCRMSPMSVSIAARLSPSCHAMMWSTGFASGSRLSGRTFSFSFFRAAKTSLVMKKARAPAPVNQSGIKSEICPCDTSRRGLAIAPLSSSTPPRLFLNCTTMIFSASAIIVSPSLFCKCSYFEGESRWHCRARIGRDFAKCAPR